MKKFDKKELRAAMKQLGYDKWEIDMKIEEMETLDGWKAITLKELKEMNDDEKSKLMSYCWHDGRPRCDCIGISDVEITPANHAGHVLFSEINYDVKWSDSNGDPHLNGIGLDEEINNIGDGDWNYGLFKKKQTKSKK